MPSPRKTAKAPAARDDSSSQRPVNHPPVPVALTLAVGPLTLSVDAVAWTGLSRAVGALMQARRLILAEWPELHEARDLGCVPGAGPLDVSDHTDYGDRRGRRRMGF